MGNVVMPKNSSDIDVLIPILEYYYNNQNWIENSEYIEYIKKYLLENEIDNKEVEPQHYTKRMQILSYFNFIEWDDINNNQSVRRITKYGKQFFEAVKSENNALIREIIISSLENTVFGRNNCGAPTSDSDVEAPCLCIRLILDLEYITKNEFAYCLYQLQDKGFTYSTILQQLKDARENIIKYELPKDANKYLDWKPINFLERFSILKTEASQTFIEKEVLSIYLQRLQNLKVYNIDKDKSLTKKINTTNNYILENKQIIYYGVPGCGKSYSINNKLKELDIKTENTYRVVFHPEFSNSDFIGQIIPTLTNKGVDYKFTPGEFTKILRLAYENPSNKYALIIEEINRGNAAAIFGDLFQLLDRLEENQNDAGYTQGWSSYCIMNDSINAYIRGIFDEIQTSYNEKIPNFNENTGIRLPPNLSLFATMNTSDQNVFKLDNAFKRRWDLEMIPNEFDFTCDDEEQQLLQLNQCNADIEGFEELTDFTWGAFRAAVNELIINPDNGGETNSFSDKQIGTWFVKAVKTEEDSYYIPLSIFKNKVLEYLWDDVFTEDFTIFNSEYKTLAQIIEALPEKADNIFTDDFYTKVEDWNKVISEKQIATHEKTKEEVTPQKTINEKTPYLEKLETIIQESQPNYQLNLNCKEYIGLIEKDAEKGNNFMFFKLKKRKQECEIVCKTKVDKEFEEYLTNNFGGIKQAAASKSKVYYTVTIPYPAEDVLTEKYNVIKETAKKAFELQ